MSIASPDLTSVESEVDGLEREETPRDEAGAGEQHHRARPNPDLPGKGVRLAMGVFQKRGKYFIDFYVDGKRIRECVGRGSRRIAADALKARHGEIVQGRYRPQVNLPSPLFSEFRMDAIWTPRWARWYPSILLSR